MSPARLAHRIRTPRLLLRCWTPQDAPRAKAAIEESIDHLRRWMPWARQEPESLERKAERFRRFRADFEAGRDFIYGIFDPAERRVLGGTGLHRRIGAGAGEIGYWIHAAHSGRGLGTEAAAAVTRVAFEVMGLRRVEIHCDVANAASAAIPRKLGYRLQVTIPGLVASPQAAPRDLMIWTMLAGEFPASPAAAVEVEAQDEDGRPLAASGRPAIVQAGVQAGPPP